MRLAMISAAALAAMLAPAASQAETLDYYSTLRPLSGSGVSGRADLSFDNVANTLQVRVKAKGLEPNQLHVQHIHGRFDADGNPIQSVTPSFANGADTDKDGFIELGEGVPFYGPIVLSLTDDTKTGFDGFPTAPDGMIDETYMFDLTSTSAFGEGFEMADLLPLYLREIVLHGRSLTQGQGFAPGEADGIAGYKTVLPVAAGTIAPVPLPATALLLVGGMAGLGAVRARRAKATAA